VYIIIILFYYLLVFSAKGGFFRETSSAGPSLSSIVENNYLFISENTTIPAGPIVLNDTSHSTAHEAEKEAPLTLLIDKVRTLRL
jgi:hypothetical protein